MRKLWTPLEAGPCALRHMELPVGDFINDALTGEIPEAARGLLVSNVKDEVNHDIALNYITDAYGVDAKAEKEALLLREAWVSHPDHTITKAMVAERAVFFVLLPFLRAYGDAGNAHNQCRHQPRRTSPRSNEQPDPPRDGSGNRTLTGQAA